MKSTRGKAICVEEHKSSKNLAGCFGLRSENERQGNFCELDLAPNLTGDSTVAEQLATSY
jgi:hypothetical protein